MNEQTQNKLIDADKRLMVTRGKGSVGRAKWVKGVKSMVRDGK